MMAKHTPGPWVAEGFEQIAGNGQFYGGLIMGNDDVIVAQCVMPHNARLIAAAPELLEALKLFVSHPGVSQLCTRDSRMMTNALAAIAKATRSTP